MNITIHITLSMTVKTIIITMIIPMGIRITTTTIITSTRIHHPTP